MEGTEKQMEKLEKAKKILKDYHQEQLLVCYDKLSKEKQEQLLDQILEMDMDLILKLYENTKKNLDLSGKKIEPIGYQDKEKLTKDQRKCYLEKGEEAIKAGKYAVVTMAGGQGTRLGYMAPKGTFTIGGGIEKSLFEALSDTIREANETYHVNIPWYIMTSRENNDATVAFFEEHHFFGFQKEDVKFFKQGELPMIGQDGKILIGEDGLVKLAADGHGGVFESMIKNHIVEDMKQRGVEWIFIAGVDNVLAGLVDPIAVGISIENHTLATGKSVVKSNPHERVGVFCKKNNKPYVIEYSEISDEMAEAVDDHGELLYGESHILLNLFNIKAIEEIGDNQLPYHSAFKKATYINEKGEKIVPEEPNAYKFEAFLFDAFERLENMSILRVKREDEFAPVKNADGVDSPDTARELYKNYLERKAKNAK